MFLRSPLAVALMISGLAIVSPAQTNTANLKVRHIHIWVKDVARTKAFYRDKMGFRVSNEKPGQNVEFNDGQLWFGKFSGAGRPATNAITIGLGTTSVEDAYQALKKNGVNIPNPPSAAHGEWHFMLNDPDGYEIEVEGPK